MAQSGNVWLKRILLGIGGLLGLLLLAAIIVPLVVDVNQYRPAIEKAVNEKINGELTIGKLSLSLWGQVEVDIDGVKLEDAQGTQVIAVDETYAQISFLSILSGKPHLVFRMVEPVVQVVKDEQGRLNVLDLIKETPPGEGQPSGSGGAPPADKPAEESGEVPMLDMISAAGVDVELVDAQIQFKDLGTGFVQDLEDLNVQLVDISMSRPMNLKIWADAGTELVDVIELKGPFNIHGTITPEFDELAFERVAMEMRLDFDDVAIDMGETMQKPAGLPTNVEIKMSASPEYVDISQLVVRFHNAELNAKAKITELQTPSPVVNFELKSQPIDLSEWGRLVTALKGLELEGRMDMAASAQGPLDKLEYAANLDIQDLRANAPGLLARPKMQAGVDVITNEIEAFRFEFEAPGTDLAVRGSLKDFSAPQVKVNVDSKAIDLDQLLPPPAEQPAQEKTKPAVDEGGKENEAGGAAPAGKEDETAPAKDVDQELAPIRSNEFLRSIVANVAVRVGRFKGMNLEASDILLDFSFQDLVAAIDKFNMNIFKGLIKANANIDLKPESPIYRMNTNVNQIDLQTAVESQMESLRNTVLGRLSLKASGSGRSLNSDQILKNLDMSGSFKIEEAKFATVDVGKMVVEAVNEALGDIKKKIPPLADKKIKTPESFRSQYEEISSSFDLKSGVFTAPNFKTVAIKNEGIDVEGKTVADLLSDKLDADWLVIDTYNVTQARDVAVNMNGVKVDHILAQNGEPVKFPVKVGCQLSAPCYQYDQVARYLAEIALNNVRGAAKERVNQEVDKAKARAKKELEKKKQEARKKAAEKKEEVKKKAADRAKEEAKKLKKRFGF